MSGHSADQEKARSDTRMAYQARSRLLMKMMTQTMEGSIGHVETFPQGFHEDLRHPRAWLRVSEALPEVVMHMP